MGDPSPEEMKKHVLEYMGVFGALLFFTFVTVWASSWKVALPASIVIAVAIAAIKGGLVATFFMHLKGEKPVILYCLVLTLVFFMGLILIPLSMLLLTMSHNAG
jgi:caa(3)-type oxidase subunit IV